ncbi:MAG: transketolase [Verrucomicrobia bacterium]|nr:transketolase [Verrucomicrobiota bacterium]
MSKPLNTTALAQAANTARGLAMDAVHASQSGHLGLPLGCAEIGAVLFGHALRYCPDAPRWLNRDRFVLSAGHGSMFIYGWLHLSGFDLPLNEVKRFRQLHSKTPGHPEFKETPGVECTTGPLGQGVGNAVGLAVSGKMAAARYNTAEHTIFDHHVVCLAGDGCLQEGVAAEAASFAGRQQLDNLILIYDNNDVTLDAMAAASQSEDVGARFAAYGFEVHRVDGHDMQAFLETFEKAKAATGKPQFIMAKTLIGKGIPEVAGTQKAHGEGGAKFIDAARKALGFPEHEHFVVADSVKEYFAGHAKELHTAHAAWEEKYAAWKAANPALAAELESGAPSFEELSAKIPEFPADTKIATRKAGQDVLQPVCAAMPKCVGGSADLYGSTLNYIAGGGDFFPESQKGRNIRYGIREHGMGAIMNGIAYDGIFQPSGATFLVFADYIRPSIRIASLVGLPVTYIFTHDSVGVGEDGPTHQPVETVAGLRAFPVLDVIRPGDPEECAGAFAAAFSRQDGPTLLSLTRQAIPLQTSISVADRRNGVAKGGYVAKKETGELKVILLAAGSELQHAMDAAAKLGDGVRVVSMPCMSRFDRQSDEYKDSVLPKSCRKRVAVEAGISMPWFKYVGLDGKTCCIDRFGMSAPGGTVMKELGMTADHVVAAVNSLG